MLNTDIENEFRMFNDATLLALKSQEARIAALEAPAKKTLFQTVKENTSAIALFLGLVLTFASIYDTFWSKPAADRISRLSQFNQAVNAAAKIRQELTQAQSQSISPQAMLGLMSLATPQILNNISTAKAISREINNHDIGVPQLIILISEAYTAGDLESAKEFIDLAVAKKDTTLMLQSEAKRYQGRYFFLTGNVVEGRKSFEEAIKLLGDIPTMMSARAFALGDFMTAEALFGDCNRFNAESARFETDLVSPYTPLQARVQMAKSLADQMSQYAGKGCKLPQGVLALIQN